jgi:alpha-amylase
MFELIFKKNNFNIVIYILIILFYINQAIAQPGFDDPRIMLQGFYWESYRHGHPENKELRKHFDSSKKWYEIVKENAPTIQEGHFDLIWLPPPSFAGDYSAGYNPKEYFKLNNSYGDAQQHRAMLEALLNKGVEPIADIVINHRDGSSKWADFRKPDWICSKTSNSCKSICKSDEAFSRDGSEVKDLPIADRGTEEDYPKEYTNHHGTTYRYNDFRDICHSSTEVRRDIIKFLKYLQSFGYRGWRFDMVHGYHAKWVALYNNATHPTFSVGEYDWGEHAQQRGWIWNSATIPGDLKTASNVFDFTTMFTLKNNKANYLAWSGFGNGVGMIGDTTDGIPWKNRAVTFLENHDTGFRTNPNGTFEKDHQFDSFANNWEVEQGYAYILTHPGVPTVYWKHYFDWGSDLREKIKALNNARKIAGVHSGSKIHPQDNARERGIYAAMVEGKKGELYVRIGGSDNDWQPFFSSYEKYREYASGNGWKVWIKIPNNPGVQQAQHNSNLPIPTITSPDNIEVSNKLINFRN